MEYIKKIKNKLKTYTKQGRKKLLEYADKKIAGIQTASDGSALAGRLNQIKTGFSNRVYKRVSSEKGPLEGLFSVKREPARDTEKKFDEIIQKKKFDVTNLPKEVRKKYPNKVLLKYVSTPGLRMGRGNGYGGVEDKENIINIYEKIPSLKRVLDNILPHVESFYSTPARLLTTSIRRTYHVPEEIMDKSEAYSNYWHTDGHPIGHVRVLVALDKIDENKGPFHYIGYDESKNILNGNFDRKSDGVPGSLVEEKCDVKKFTGKAGDCMICNTNVVLHRAGNPSPGEYRDLMLLTFAPVNEKCNMTWSKQSKYGLVRGIEDLSTRLRW